MRILHFLWALDNGGAENLAVDLANEQSREHEVVIFVSNNRLDETVRLRIGAKVRLVTVGRPPNSRNPFWIAKMLFLLQMLRPDVIHSHAENLSILGLLISAPMVLTVHDTHIDLPKTAIRFARICCISRAVYSDITSRYPLLTTVQVNNGVMTEQITKSERQAGATVRAIQISRLVHEKKGQDLLIGALAKVNSASDLPKLEVWFVGEGPSLMFLKDIAAKAGVSRYCQFVGALPRLDIYKTLWQYDILIQPSRYEGFGLTVAEGMAAGVTVVVSDIEGPMEIIEDGSYGFFFKSDDIDSLAASLRAAILSLETAEGNAMRRAGQRYADEKYNVKRTSLHYCSVYKEVVNV